MMFERKCSECGDALDREVWITGGNGGSFVATMHSGCAEDPSKVPKTPWLAFPNVWARFDFDVRLEESAAVERPAGV